MQVQGNFYKLGTDWQVAGGEGVNDSSFWDVQARESFPLSEALFKEQMATSTDVLDARTQLSETMTRYYNALYDFHIALAALDRAMGKPSIDIAEVQ